MENFKQERLEICKNCPIYSSRNGGTCNSSLWLDPKTGDVSGKPKVGYFRGCGCSIKWKVSNESSYCPAHKW
jgi:hypothetical protein